MNTTTTRPPWNRLLDTFAAELTEAIYPMALRHATVPSWIDLELEIWKTLSEKLRHGLASIPGVPADGIPAGPSRTRPVLERLVSYFGLDENDKATTRRFMSYKIIAGPGPGEDGGSASIVTLALSDPSYRCDSCPHFHTVEKGGAAAALAAAIRYLDAYHSRHHLQKVESDVRG